VSGAESGDAVLRLNFFDIEAQTLDTRGLEEVVDLQGVAKGLAGNHGDDVEGDVVVLQQLQTAHGAQVMASLTKGKPTGVITRNSYGCIVLNAARMFIADVDRPPTRAGEPRSRDSAELLCSEPETGRN
jgi:hypothetical protein